MNSDRSYEVSPELYVLYSTLTDVNARMQQQGHPIYNFKEQLKKLLHEDFTTQGVIHNILVTEYSKTIKDPDEVLAWFILGAAYGRFGNSVS